MRVGGGIALKILAMAALLIVGAASYAQTTSVPIPSIKYADDPNSVDRLSGYFVPSEQLLAIGYPGAGGLTFSRKLVTNNVGWSSQGTEWRHNWVITLKRASEDTDGFYGSYVAGGNFSSAMEIDQETWVYRPRARDGSTLTSNGSGSSYTFTTRDGTVIDFQLIWLRTLQAMVAVLMLLQPRLPSRTERS